MSHASGATRGPGKPLIFDSVEEMLSPESLSLVVESAVATVELNSLQNEGFSDSAMESVLATTDRGEVHRLVIKRFPAMENDWLSRLTHDSEVREVALFRSGWFQRLPRQCLVPTVAASRDGASWACLMWDVADSLFPSGDTPISPDDIAGCLADLAALHAHFSGRPPFSEPSLGLCSIRDWTMLLSPEAGLSETALGQANDVSGNLAANWQLFAAAAPPEAARIVSQLQIDVQPLLNKLGQAPHTLLHGDYKFANLGSRPEGTVMLDWGMSLYGPPLLDLAWFLAINSAKLTIPREEVIALYRSSLALHGMDYPAQIWQRDLDLALMAGGVMRLGWAKALGAQAEDIEVRRREQSELEWWSERAILAGRWLT